MMPARGHPCAPRHGPRSFSSARKQRIETQRPQVYGFARPRLRILGVDPGSQATGYGVIDRVGSELRWVAHGVLRPGRTASLAPRLASLLAELSAILALHRPDVASVEDVFVSVSARSALVLGQARGAALAALGAAGVTLVEYTPARIKQTVAGDGRAPKTSVQRVVRRLLALERMPPPDAADALAAAICHAHAGPLEKLRRPRPRAHTRFVAGPLRVRPAR
jgi:crossover junction endodeoxyribonuclease RuvC